MAVVAYLKGLHFHLPVDLEISFVLSPTHVGDMTGMATGMGVGLEAPDIGIGIFSDEIKSVEDFARRIAVQLDGKFQSVTSAAKVGAPSHEITELANQSHADLIVLGAVGHSALESVLLGSVTEYVANQSQASTLVVRPNKTSESKKSPCRVLIALENSPHDQKLLAHVHSLQFDCSAEIHLVHVLPIMNFFRQDLRKSSPKIWTEAYDAAVEHVQSLAETVMHAGYQVHAEVQESAHVGKSLETYAQTNHCDLIVTGDRGHNGLHRLMLGSTSRNVLRHADSSVLVAKEQRSMTLGTA